MNIRNAQSARSQVGSLGAVLFSALFLIIIGIGAVALDFAHMSTVRTELQSATDAAALAGAMDLGKDPESVESHALEVASSNSADGVAVSNNSANTQVTCLVDDTSEPPTVQVEAVKQVSHMLAPIFGRKSDSLGVASRSAYYSRILILGENQAFPVAVSIDELPNGASGSDKPLSQSHIGDDFAVVVRPSGTPGRNAAWTSFNYGSANTNQYVSLIEQVMGIRPYDPNFHVPALEIGKTHIHLDNGQNVGTGTHSTYSTPIRDRPFIVIPVIPGTNYNQSQVVIGFITMKVRSIESQGGATTFRGTLVKGMVRGWPGDHPPNANENALTELSPSAVKLLSAEQ